MSLSPELLLHAYSIGIFPMAEHRDDPEVFWVDPKRRGVFPLGEFHISRSLARRLRRSSYRATIDQNFTGVLDGCADRADTWINEEIRAHYITLHKRGHAHSQEIWDGDTLVGGVYGVILGAAFFGESMFSRKTDASKIALVKLVEWLREERAILLDTQWMTDHLRTFGAYEMPASEYRKMLAEAVEI